MPHATQPLLIHLDAVGGIAGDMFVAALISARPDLRERVFADLDAMLPPPLAPRLEAGMAAGIAALRFGLHGMAAAHGHAQTQAQALRYTDMLARIDSAPLHPGTAREAAAILRRLAEAESRIHGVALEAVHFHEIADWDSLADIVAAGSIAGALSGARWSVSDLPLGGGLVRTLHGQLPVPAPATAAILTGFRWRQDGVPGERVTPTGAAILAHLVAAPGAGPTGGRLEAIGTGAGTRSLDGLPNVLRALVFVAEPAGPATPAEVVVLSFDVDDMTGEEIGLAADRLRVLPGVLDLTTGQRSGKKGRPVADFRLLVAPDAAEAAAAACFLETATIGLRWRREARRVLGRQLEPGGHGAPARKRVTRPDGSSSLKVESDAIADIAGLAQRRAAKAKGEAE